MGHGQDLTDLTQFELGMIVGARKMGRSVSEIATTLGFSRATVARVFQEYEDSEHGQQTSTAHENRGRQQKDKEEKQSDENS